MATRLPVPPCKTWTGAVSTRGYGVVRRGGKNHYVHRKAWIEAHGPVPKGFVVHHVCEEKLCYEVTHLMLMTHQEHRRHHGLSGAGAAHAAKTHCKEGHEFTPENTYVWRGARKCRACRAAAWKRHYERKAA